MITTEYLANFIEEKLNENEYGKHFLVFADEGDMRNAKRCCKEYKYWTNCLLEVISSTITPIKNITFETATVQLMFIVDLAEAGQTKVGEQDREQSRNLIGVKNTIYDFIEGLNGKTITSQIGGKTYTVTIGFGQPTDGQKTQLGEVSEALPLYLNMTFSFFENGVNANDCHVLVNGEDLYFTRCVISKVRVAEQSEFASEKGGKSYVMAGGKSVDMVIPTVDSTMGRAIMKDILGSDNNTAMSVYISTPIGETAFIGMFGNNSANMDAGSNLGYNISIVQGKENLLKYDSGKWVIFTVDERAQLDQWGYPENTNHYVIPEITCSKPTTIYWGDGKYTVLKEARTVPHLYEDGKNTHVIRVLKAGIITYEATDASR